MSILSPRLRYSLPFYIVGWFVTLYRFFPYGEGFSFTWFQRYFYDLQTALSEILAGKVGYITELVAVTIIVTGILLFAVFSIYIQHFYIVYGAMCLYLLTVVIFNDFNLTWHLLGCVLQSSLQPDQNPTAENSTRMVVLAGAHPAMFVAVGWSNTAAKNRDSRSLGSSYHWYTHTSESTRLLSVYRRTWCT